MPRFFRCFAEGVFDLEDLVLRTYELAEFVEAASMGLVAKHRGKTVIEVNLEESANSTKYDLVLLGKSREILQRIIPTNEQDR